MQVAFMHVPKTAGTSIITSLIAALQPRLCVGGFDRSLFGSFDDFQSLGEEARRYVYADADLLPAEADMIAGHFSLTTLRHRFPSAIAFTVLREPFSRLLSHWTFWRSTAETAVLAWGTWTRYLEPAQQGFIGFLTEPRIACQVDNVALRLLLWPHPLIPDNGFISTEHDLALLTEARARLQTLSHANIIENPALSSDLAAWCGRPFNLVRVKETGPVPPGYRVRLEDELTPATMNAWRMRSRLDLVLWTFVCQQVMPAVDQAALREKEQQRSIRRYGLLLGFPS
jgi:Sulfotransferase family